MSQVERMTEEEFVKCFGLPSARAKEILLRFRQLVNEEVRETICHADYYIDPENYCDAEYLKHHYGEDCLDKDDDDDGYPNLYDYGRDKSSVSAFMDLISWHTSHGGHTSAIRACELMGLEFPRDK